MGIQARLSRPFTTQEDTEKLPLVNEPEAQTVKDHPVKSKSALKLSLSAPALFLILLYFITPASLYEFPFPSKPTVTPPYILEGIAQCNIIARPPPDFKPHDGRRKYSDRYVEGTGPVLLKNGTVWTGEQGGVEVMYGASVWMEGGVIRKIGTEKEMMEYKGLMKTDVEEVELHGAWVTPGVSDVSPPLTPELTNIHRSSICTREPRQGS
jgi:hypothetical protein